jgi:cytochrome P450
MFEKALKLKDLWHDQVEKDGGNTTINVIVGLGRAALDVISTAGFDYEMNALDEEKPSELSKTFNSIFTFDQQLPLLEILHVFFPPLRVFATERSRQITKAVKIMGKIGRDLVQASKAEALAEKSTLNSSVARRDLLSLLIRSNLSQDIPEHQRLSDEEVISQIPTFLVAGHETTSTATSFALLALSERPEIQSKLRDELWSVSSDMPTMEELDALPYLDAVVRETLRVHPPVPNTLRKCMNDDAIPVSAPFTDKNGQVHDFIRIEKGDTIFVPINAINRSKQIWGDDASEFKPERWDNLPEAVTAIPGLLNMLSFLGGPRACIGYRFSIIEIKALLFTLVRSFEFALAVPQNDIVKRLSAAVQRPMLKSDPKAGSQLPLLVKPYRET